jgi:hypothetical protein
MILLVGSPGLLPDERVRTGSADQQTTRRRVAGRQIARIEFDSAPPGRHKEHEFHGLRPISTVLIYATALSAGGFSRHGA